MGDDVAEPVEARPWRPEDGRQPFVRTWPSRGPLALWLWSKGRWRWATVMARQDWAVGRIAYR
ncbi:hypothetical protein AB0N62_45715 [Streptomyces sp. NPDC093982]|uniref:hypothetical protein n=1 Tax=Streptomyces sp. NPDC093982 TaxID=3155077 RepID=UPI00343C59DD